MISKQRIIAHSLSAQALALAELFQSKKRMLVLVANQNYSEQLKSELSIFLDAKLIHEFPAWDNLAFEQTSPQISISAERLKTADLLLNSDSELIAITTAQAITQKLIDYNQLLGLTYNLNLGMQLELNQLAQQVVQLNYQKVDLVEEVGEFALRGQVLDIFLASETQPVRIEFESDHITKIKYFDQQTQRSTKDLESIRFIACREILSLGKNILDRDSYNRIKERGKLLETPPREIVRSISALKSGELQSGLEFLQYLVFDKRLSFFDLLKKQETLVIANLSEIDKQLEKNELSLIKRYQSLRENHFLIPELDSVYLSREQLVAELECKDAYFIETLNLKDSAAQIEFKELSIKQLSVQLTSHVGSGQALNPLKKAFESWLDADFRIVICVGSMLRAEKLKAILLGLGYEAKLIDKPLYRYIESDKLPALTIAIGSIEAGVQIQNKRLVLIAEQQIFSSKSQRNKRSNKTSLKRIMASLAQLKEDDYLVHVDYGIGIYRGLKHLEIEGNQCDFLQIDYADSKLYLPVHLIGKIQKYSAAEGKKPQIDKLASTRWIKTKQKIKSAVIPLASELLKLYAARSSSKGWRFDHVGAADQEFAERFNFDETPDQLKAIEETLNDMASERPMDRLICGDVGFGKTEVALRAAMKATQHAKQVAVLAPTTILVDQHYSVFRERFAEYPIKVGAISRFYGAKQNKATLAKLASGELDIVIGTQKLLSRSTEFNDLGLVIIDEEHRLGVKHKERLKTIKKQVDVLTLTATPIPRTLHMALLGIRDVSVISTPPINRKLVQTYLASYDPQLIRDAIMREFDRKGQVFYVHNRIQTIEATAAQLKEIVPEAEIGIVHSELSERSLENVMHAFHEKKINLLLATSIIESGLDFPSANTIIIERADLFGLAQAYQLRGRVGRSNRQAYCYFLIPKGRITQDAEKRLHALQALDDLGLGFNLAVRDLEIRGAGNLLGKEQSGYVSNVGFDLYTKLLKEAILNLKGEELEIDEIVEPDIKIPVEAYLPESYIPDVTERLILYQRFASASSEQEIDDLLNEGIDRFGTATREVLALVDIMKLRNSLKRIGIVKLEGNDKKIMLEFSPKAAFDRIALVKHVKSQSHRFKIASNGSLTILEPGRTIDELRWQIESLFLKTGV